MNTKFYKCIEEILTTAGVGIGSKSEETDINLNNDDVYAKGDARNPFYKPKRKKRKKLKSVRESVFNNALRVDDAFKLLKGKFPEKEFKVVTSLLLEKGIEPITLKSQIVTEILTPMHKLMNQNSKLKADENTFNLKRIIESIQPHWNSERVIVIGAYIKNNKIGVTWTLV